MSLMFKHNIVSRRHTYTARDYVQDGLVLHLDAIENAGYGLHSSNITSWTDLAQGKKFTVHNCEICDSCIRMNGVDSYCDCPESQVMYNKTGMTLEVSVRLSEDITQWGMVFAGANSDRVTGNQIFAVHPEASFHYVTFTSKDNMYPSSVKTALLDEQLVVPGRQIHSSCTYGANFLSSFKPFIDGKYVSLNVKWSASHTKLWDFIGCRCLSNAFGGFFMGDVYFVRVYDSTYDDMKRMQNYIIDKERFGLS